MSRIRLLNEIPPRPVDFVPAVGRFTYLVRALVAVNERTAFGDISWKDSIMYTPVVLGFGAYHLQSIRFIKEGLKYLFQ